MGGAERQALYLVEHLAKLPKCSVEVLSFEDGPALRPALDAMGVKIHVVPYDFRWPKSLRARALTRMAWVLRTQIRPDAILPFVGIHSKTLALVWPYSGARFCWWNQQDEGRDLSGTEVERGILRKLPCITSNSVAGQIFLSETYDLPADAILVYNNGTPVPETPAPSDLRARLGLGDRPVVSMIANITRFKDHATLLDAWSTLRKSFDGPATPVLLLAGHLKERSTVEDLKMRAFELGLSSDDVKFLGPVADVGELVAESDLVVHSSLTEGCPNAVCEAMALGRAVVATDIPGCRQALGNDADDVLAAPRDPAALASKMARLLRDRSLREQLGARNRQRIAEEFSIEGMNRFFQTQIEKGLGVSLA